MTVTGVDGLVRNVIPGDELFLRSIASRPVSETEFGDGRRRSARYFTLGWLPGA